MRPCLKQLGLLLTSLVVAVSVSSSAFAVDCPQTRFARLKALAEQAVGMAAPKAPERPAFSGRQNFAGLTESIGQCEKPNQNALRGHKVDTYHLVARDDAEAAFDAYNKSHPGHPWRRYDGQPLNVTDVVAIDAVARTLMGEMGNEGFCGKPYMAGAARVIMNRGIQILNDPAHYARMFGSGKICKDFSQCMANASLASRQFSVWNHLPYDRGRAEAKLRSKNPHIKGEGRSEMGADDSQDSVTNTALCPKGVPTPAQQKSWRDAVELATIAVTAPWEMKEITPDIHAMWYTSNMNMCGGDELPDGHAYGQLLNKNSCLRLWRDDHSCHRGGGKKAKAKAPSKKKAKK